jgi:RimJ/RimL family protein N-acetyltransferase
VDDVVGSQLAGRSVRLRALVPRDIEFLYGLAMASGDIWRWRLRGRTPSPAEFEAFVWSGGDIQFLVERHDGRPCGHVTSYQTDEAAGTTKVAMLMDSAVRGAGWPVEGIFLFLAHLFGAFPLRKVYFEVPQFNVPSFGSFLDRYTTEEGRLRSHTFANGDFCDVVIAAMWRYHWRDLESSALGRAMQPRVKASEPADSDH